MVFVPKFLTIVDLFEKSVEKYAPRDLFGVKTNDAWTWITYGEVKRRVDAFRRALSEEGIARDGRVAIISNNRVEWAIASFATVGLTAQFVPMYESQLPKEWEYILRDCEAEILIVSTEAIYHKVKGFLETIPSLRKIVRMGAKESEPDSFDAWIDRGSDNPLEPSVPDKDDIAFLIYTSGTTGNPKGVKLSHENIASNVSAVHECFDMIADDRTLSFLPWAHSFGLTCELHCMTSMGASMALNTAVDKLVAEMPEVRPTILISVPRIFNRIHDNVQKQIAGKPAPIQALFRAGLAASIKKRAGQSLGLTERVSLSLADKIVFSKIRAKFGGQLRYAISGGAALSREVGQFIDALGINVYEGYGLTETSPIISANRPGHRVIGSVGQMIPGCRVVIDKEATADAVQGEIIAYGPNVMKGYHHLDEETAAVLLEDGGFRTGDMGYMDNNGYLFITGRVKEQYKLENGKYVVPVPLEEAVKLSLLITNAFVHGANRPFNVALIVPNMEELVEWAKAQGIEDVSAKSLLRNEKVIAKVREEIEAKSQGFKSYEKIKQFTLIEEDFTTENGMLTPSMKVKRRVVLEKYGNLVEDMYR
ncbi:MAG: Long-chain-fatty-acid--CoA ligase FadD15 [Deltaproteobacteria bacterium ADurb.Bin207]|jgi:long-chain acyl-CoA synthetase|nr:MAG: Long-chain-fatty-acid--CoA ligase FadD15 [Deltaproteobacteria bacterium ADurb.Bin207]